MLMEKTKEKTADRRGALGRACSTGSIHREQGGGNPFYQPVGGPAKRAGEKKKITCATKFLNGVHRGTEVYWLSKKGFV